MLTEQIHFIIHEFQSNGIYVWIFSDDENQSSKEKNRYRDSTWQDQTEDEPRSKTKESDFVASKSSASKNTQSSQNRVSKIDI